MDMPLYFPLAFCICRLLSIEKPSILKLINKMILLVNNSKSSSLVVFYCKRCIKSLIKMQEHVSMISNLSCFICILYKKLNYPKVFKLKYYKRHPIKKNITWFLLLNTGNLKYTVELLEFLVVQISWYS